VCVRIAIVAIVVAVKQLEVKRCVVLQNVGE
jgi:hypothetical protein